MVMLNGNHRHHSGKPVGKEDHMERVAEPFFVQWVFCIDRGAQILSTSNQAEQDGEHSSCDCATGKSSSYTM